MKKLINYFCQGHRLTFKKGEIVTNTEELHEYVYFIEKGCVKAYSISRAGNMNIHIIYQPGDIFPLAYAVKNLIQGTFVESSEVTHYEAMEDVALWRVSKKQFMEFSEADPDVGNQLLQRLLSNYELYQHRVDNSFLKSAYEQTVHWLHYLGTRYGHKRNGGVTIGTPLTHQDIADFISMARETVSRELEKLKRRDLIEANRHHIVIKDMRALAEELERS